MYNFDAIPSELKILPQWCDFMLEVVDGQKTKVPYSPTTGQRASSTDPSTWSTFEAARAAYQDLERYDGICFMLAKENGIVFVDLDDCIVDGIIMAWALKIAKRLKSYTERSQSGKGLHILIRGLKPGDRCRRVDYAHKIEIYGHSRQCCLTGDLVAV
jgi:putative DNA primase/helicase